MVLFTVRGGLSQQVLTADQVGLSKSREKVSFYQKF